MANELSIELGAFIEVPDLLASRKYYWFQEDIGIDEDTFNVVQTESSSYLFSNMRDKTNFSPLNAKDRDATVLGNSYISDAKNEFRRLFSNEIAKMESFYKRRFDVQFGIVKYYR